MPRCVSQLAHAALDERPFLLALGIISAPSHLRQRQWLRSHLPVLREHASGWAWRFVIGTPSPESLPCWRLCFHPGNGQQAQAKRLMAARCDALETEDALTGDLLFVPAADNEAVGCIDKTYAWFMHAVHAYPRASYVAMTQDDSVLLSPNLAHVLVQLKAHDYVYGGRVQFSGFVEQPPTYRHCGWTESPRVRFNLSRLCQGYVDSTRPTRRMDAAQRRQLGKPVASVGIFPFAQGALELFSRQLALHVFASAWTVDWVATARRVAEGGRAPSNLRWECGAEDITTGYIVHSNTRGLNVTLAALNELIVDADAASDRPLPSSLVAVHHVAPPPDYLAANVTPTRSSSAGERGSRRPVASRGLASLVDEVRAARDAPLRSRGVLRCCARHGGACVASGGDGRARRVHGFRDWDERVLSLPAVDGWMSCSWSLS